MKYAIALLTLAACGSSSSDPAADPDASTLTDTPDAADSTARYFPMAIGASWDYQVTENGVVGSKTQTVLALEDVGGPKAGITAFKVQTSKPSGKTTLSWQEDTGSALIRHKEQVLATDQSLELEEYYSPSKLRIDELEEHLSLGASWVLDYQQASEDFVAGGGVVTLDKSETWTVDAVDETITVPAGTFSCIVLHKVSATSTSDKTYWFARGVGKIREEGATQLEELTSYSMP